MNVTELYEKVRRLVDGGATEGERQAACEAMRRLEERYPGLLSEDRPAIEIEVDEKDFFVRGGPIASMWRAIGDDPAWEVDPLTGFPRHMEQRRLP